jgi:hypothetical protein
MYANFIFAMMRQLLRLACTTGISFICLIQFTISCFKHNFLKLYQTHDGPWTAKSPSPEVPNGNNTISAISSTKPDSSTTSYSILLAHLLVLSLV